MHYECYDYSDYYNFNDYDDFYDHDFLVISTTTYPRVQLMIHYYDYYVYYDYYDYYD